MAWYTYNEFSRPWSNKLEHQTIFKKLLLNKKKFLKESLVLMLHWRTRSVIFMAYRLMYCNVMCFLWYSLSLETFCCFMLLSDLYWLMVSGSEWRRWASNKKALCRGISLMFIFFYAKKLSSLRVLSTS